MKILYRLFLVLFLFCFIPEAEAQKKNGIRPYTVATAYENLKKNYPFVSLVEAINSEKIIARENVIYKKTAEKNLTADVYMPVSSGSQKYPAVLLIHGGGWLTGTKENLQVMSQHLANSGYVAITVAYRLGTDATYPAGVLDLKDAVKWMRENANQYNIDREKIAVLGASAGAQLATLLGVTPNADIYQTGNKQVSDEVQAIVNIDGIVSFVHPEAEEGWMAATWFGGSKEEKYDMWKEASPLEYVDANTPPTLFINSSFPRFHAGRDDMIKILNKNGIYSEIHTLEDSPHTFWLFHPWFNETVKLTTNFLDRVFKDSASAKKPYRKITVSKDGSGDFSSIQEAINSTRDLGPGEAVINIKAGTYNEKLNIPSWKRKLTLKGEDRKKTIITNDDFSGKTDPQTGKNFPPSIPILCL